MSDIIKVIRSLDKLRSCKPAKEVDIDNAELELCVPFANDYREYLAEFGAISARGVELTGLIDAEYINVVLVTQEKRHIYPQVPNTLYVVEDPAIDGIVIWQDTSGHIYKTTPNSDPVKICDSLAEYLTKVIQHKGTS